MSAINNTDKRYDCIIIGAGHNGLVCAAYLARRGRSVLVCEATDRIGGAATTREFAPGFRVSAGAHLLYMMPTQLIRELNLFDLGLRLEPHEVATTAIGDGGPLPLRETNNSELLARSPKDAAALPLYNSRLRRLASALHPILGNKAPRLGTNTWEDTSALARHALRIRRLGRRDMRELLRIAGMCVHDLLDEYFETPLLQGALAVDAVLGSNAGPRSPGTVFTLLHRMAAAGGHGRISQPVGGLGALCDALAKSAVRSGAVIRTRAPVAKIQVRNDRATGVVLESGEELNADVVISSADPKKTFLSLVGSRHLDAGFVRRICHLRSEGLTAKVHLGLDRIPTMWGVEPEALLGRLVLARSLQYVEHAFNHAKYGEYSRAPILEITIPTLADPSLAPQGKHVLSAVVQYAPYSLRAGWSTQRDQFLKTVIDTLETCAPGLTRSVCAAELLTPQDFERDFGITGGHWHHTELALDQFLMMRPVTGAAQHSTPLPGLFVCGAGCHPGGGVMGISGRNAAAAVLQRVA